MTTIVESLLIEKRVVKEVLESLPPHTKIDLLEIELMHRGAHARGFGEDYTGFPVKHRFTPGMYIREIFMPAGSIVVSYQHRFEHPFVVTQGRALVYHADGEVVDITAPHTGITPAGTRRVLLILEDMVWTTFHVTDETEIEAVERYLYETPSNPLLPLYEHGMQLLAGGAS